MSKMSYCRFHNTSLAFADCSAVLAELTDGGDKLSDEELQAAQRLIRHAQDLFGMLVEVTGVRTADILDHDFGNDLDYINS